MGDNWFPVEDRDFPMIPSMVIEKVASDIYSYRLKETYNLDENDVWKTIISFVPTEIANWMDDETMEDIAEDFLPIITDDGK